METLAIFCGVLATAALFFAVVMVREIILIRRECKRMESGK